MWIDSKMKVIKEFKDYFTKEIIPVGTILTGNGHSGNECAHGDSYGKQINISWDDIENCMVELRKWKIYNTTEEEREKIFNSNFNYYYDGISTTIHIDGSREQFENALKFIGRK